jgi:hypothetical protein
VYTITIAPDAAGRSGISGTVPSTVGNSTIALVDPWAAMMTVQVHVSDAVTGANLGPSTVQLTGGPANAALKTFTTDANGNIVGGISVPVGLGTYTLTVPALAPRLQGTTTFSATVPPVLPVQLSVPRPMGVFTITLRGNSNALLGGMTVTVTGGASPGFTATGTTSIIVATFGQVQFTVPLGAAPAYSVTVPGFITNPLSVTQVVNNPTVALTVKLTTL